MLHVQHGTSVTQSRLYTQLTVLSIIAMERKGFVNSMDMNKAMMKSPLPLRTL